MGPPQRALYLREYGLSNIYIYIECERQSRQITVLFSEPRHSRKKGWQRSAKKDTSAIKSFVANATHKLVPIPINSLSHSRWDREVLHPHSMHASKIKSFEYNRDINQAQGKVQTYFAFEVWNAWGNYQSEAPNLGQLQQNKLLRSYIKIGNSLRLFTRKTAANLINALRLQITIWASLWLED